MRSLRDVAILMALAAGVAFAPAGGNLTEAVLTALTMAFLAAIAWAIYLLSRQNQLTLATLGDRQRAILYGAVGMIALLIAGTTKLFSTGGGTVIWIALLAASVVAIWRIWKEANTY
ncbi:MAG: hypothetical protein WB507_03165 [Solirubrobacterales bacterium]